jgi:hypothetical protein
MIAQVYSKYKGDIKMNTISNLPIFKQHGTIQSDIAKFISNSSGNVVINRVIHNKIKGESKNGRQ